MSVELVTGYSGVGSDGNPNRHVSSTDDARRQAGTVGLGNYVFSTAGKLAAQMEDANTLVMQPGDGMINGHHFTCPDTTSFTIPTGVQGQKVSNLAVIRYEVGADSVETCTPLVLTGEPSADEPEDPAYNEGDALAGDSPVDLPLYRVVTDGINAGSPEPLFSVLVPYAEFRDSVSQVKVLHSGADYMNASQSITLSEPVSSQRTGIVLAWSSFSDDVGQNYGWSYFFVPKSHVGLDGTGGIRCFALGEDGAMAKYVYVHDERIDGYANNAWDGDMSGIRVNNYAYVLRYVYGV